MAENIDRILQQLKQLQVEAGGAEQRLERLYKMLSNIVQLSARGGIPTETGVGRVTGRLLTGEQQVAGRPRVSGGAYARLSAVAGSVQTIIDEIINTQSKLAERELAAIKASSLRQTRFGAIPKTRLPTTLATPIEEQAPSATTPSTREFAPTVPTSAQMYADTEIEKLLAGMSKTEKMGISPVEISRLREQDEDAYNAIYGEK